MQLKPIISVIVIDSRSHTHPDWVKKCIDSVKEQSLQNIELIVIDNNDRTQSIGRCYNQGVEKAEADWVYFLGDDDFVSPDFFASLTTFISIQANGNEKVVACTTYSIFFDDKKKVMSTNGMTPFGAFRRSFLLEHKLNEDIPKYIDVDIYRRLKEEGFVPKVCRWHYGYFYRSHEDQVSGKKKIKEQNGEKAIDRENIKSLPQN